MQKDIIIVGGGIAGLSAGCYAQKNGYHTALYEMHSIPGGLCTAWERKGYRFDISMHMLMGSVSGPFHTMWRELGIPQKFRFHYHDRSFQMEGMGKELSFSTDRHTLEQQMLAISPQDESLIREFTMLIFGPDMMKAASLKPKKLRNLGDSLKMTSAIVPLLRTFGRYNKMTLQEFAARFRDPFLREAVRYYVDAPGWPMLEFPMVALAGFMRSAVMEAGVPLGGSQQVMLHMADLYKERGGEIHLNSRVSDLILEGDRVTGVVLEDGTEHRAGRVIWAGDGHSLIYGILKERYMDDSIRTMYETWKPVRSIVHVMMGVNQDFSGVPSRLIFEPEQPITIAGQEFRWLAMHHHCFDPSMAPEGKSAVEVWYDSDYQYWADLAKDRKAYEAEKKRIADYTIGEFEKRWTGFASRVEVTDVPTPATYNRYTGNWKGSPDGWYVTPENMRQSEPRRTLPGLKGLQMVGQWTAPFTGTVIASLTGRQAVQYLCREDGKRFIPA